LNVDWLSHLPAPVRRSLYFGLQRAIGSRVGSAWGQFQRWACYSPAELEEAVARQLGTLLDQSVARSPYYRGLGLSRRPAEPVLEFLGRFPVLSRKLVRDRFTDLVVEDRRAELTSPDSVAPRRYDWVVVKTGGTTGLPTSVVHDPTMRDWGRASRLFAARQCGYPLGTPYFRLWGAEQDLLNTELKLPLRVQRALLGEIPMNAFRVKPEDLKRHHATLLAHPEVASLMAYVDSAVSLADFIRKHDLPRPRLRTIMACAGTVTDQWRHLLQDTFGAEVFDKYGSRDCAEIACECAAHAGLHVYSPTVFVEVVDDDGKVCPPGRTGRVLVTLLRNALFPMIRYEIGDLAQWAEPGACSCGLAWPRLKHLEGRADDMLLLADGTRLSSAFIRHFVGVSLNRQLIEQWQFEQAALGQFTFRYVPAARAGLAENVARIRDGFHLVLGRTVAIELREVAEIPPSPTGKIRWIINRVPRS
jgi:phenylacetate-CoA ligase